MSNYTKPVMNVDTSGVRLVRQNLVKVRRSFGEPQGTGDVKMVYGKCLSLLRPSVDINKGKTPKPTVSG